MTKYISIIILLITILTANVCLALKGEYNVKLYYDDLDIIYSTGGTMKNIVDRADYIVETKNIMILIKIPGPMTFKPLDNISLDLRIRCDIKFPDGQIISYGFDNQGKYMQINDKVYPVDRILLKEVIKHLPISQEHKIKQHYGF